MIRIELEFGEPVERMINAFHSMLVLKEDLQNVKIGYIVLKRLRNLSKMKIQNITN